MYLLIVLSLAISTFAGPLFSRLPIIQHKRGISGGYVEPSGVELSNVVETSEGEDLSEGGVAKVKVECESGETLDVDGKCVEPIISRNFFSFSAPEFEYKQSEEEQNIPQPKVEYNYILIHSQGIPEGPKPIVVPPPHHKTIVIVLSKVAELAGKEVIEVPFNQQKPEVYYINYNEGDNPSLPGGFDLQSALSSAVEQQGTVIKGESGNLGSESVFADVPSIEDKNLSFESLSGFQKTYQGILPSSGTFGEDH